MRQLLSKNPAALTSRDAVILGLWIGLVSGLLEAIVTYATRGLPQVAGYRKSGELVFWVAPVTYAVVFAIAAVVLAKLAGWLRRVPAMLVVTGVLALGGSYLAISYPSAVRPESGLVLSAGIAVALCRSIAGREEKILPWLRRRLPVALFVIALGGAGVQGWIAGREYFAVRNLPAASAGRPNVLVIVADALRGDRLSSAGYPVPTTPHLDEFGRSGVQYDFAFSTAPWSTPSHNTMLTGRYGFEHRMDYPVPNLRHGFPYLPEVLAGYGYRSGLFSANFSAVVQEYLDAGFHHYDTYTVRSTFSRLSLIRKIRSLRLPGLGLILSTGTKRGPTVVRSFMEWARREPSRPFFALLNFMDLHDRAAWQRDELAMATRSANGGEELPGMRSEGGDQRLLNLSYDEAVAQIDREVAALLENLRHSGLADNTLVIVTADHGDSIGEHGFAAHASSLYIEQLRVPLLIRWAGHVPAAVRVSEPVNLAGLPATVMTLLELPQSFPGAPWPMSVTPPETNGEKDSMHDALLAEFNNVRRGPLLRSLLTARWHYIVNVQTGKEELYEWPADPGELNDLAASGLAQPQLDQFRSEIKKRSARGPTN